VQLVRSIAKTVKSLVPLFTWSVRSVNFFVTYSFSDWIDDEWDQAQAGPTDRGCHPDHLRALPFECGENLNRRNKTSPPIGRLLSAPPQSSSLLPPQSARSPLAAPPLVFPMAEAPSNRLIPTHAQLASSLAEVRRLEALQVSWRRVAIRRASCSS
jgi:hypothetical protein